MTYWSLSARQNLLYFGRLKGTLEQVYLSPLPAWLVATSGRLRATVVETAFLVAILYLVVLVIAPIQLTWHAQALLPMTLLVIGSLGYSLIEGGLALVWKRVELIHELAMGMMIFFSDALIPLDGLPVWMAEVGRFSPISQGVAALRIVLIEGQTSFPVAGDGGLVLLVTTGAGWLVLTVAVFSHGEATARERGSLSHY